MTAEEQELAETRRALARVETLLASALSFLPDDLPVVELRTKRDELNEVLSGFTLARAHLGELCRRARVSGSESPLHRDIVAFLQRLDRNDLVRSRAPRQA
jgi:hypothetical protein